MRVMFRFFGILAFSLLPAEAADAAQSLAEAAVELEQARRASELASSAELRVRAALQRVRKMQAASGSKLLVQAQKTAAEAEAAESDVKRGVRAVDRLQKDFKERTDSWKLLSEAVEKADLGSGFKEKAKKLAKAEAEWFGWKETGRKGKEEGVEELEAKSPARKKYEEAFYGNRWRDVPK